MHYIVSIKQQTQLVGLHDSIRSHLDKRVEYAIAIRAATFSISFTFSSNLLSSSFFEEASESIVALRRCVLRWKRTKFNFGQGLQVQHPADWAHCDAL